MQKMSTKTQVKWRRDKVFELVSKGYNQSEIASILKISESTISRDMSYFREQVKYNIAKYMDDKLPFEFEKCLIGLNSVYKRAWNIVESSTVDERTQIQALSLAKECITNKIDLLTNARVVDDAIKFVEQVKSKSSSAKIVTAMTAADDSNKTTASVEEEVDSMKGEGERGQENDIQRPKENNC
jgi:NADH/NAD ratio-sensing transcriptional regulator Rex